MNDGDYPCILPVNFGFEMKAGKLCLYFHGSDQGSKHEIIRRDPHVSFEVDCGHMLIAEHYGIPAETFHPGNFASTAVYKITAEHYTAKRRPVKP